MAEERPKTLAAKIRKSREFPFEVGGHKFTLRRPTEVEWMDFIAGQGSTARFLPYVVGWEGVKEADIIAGGDPHPLPFDAAVCAEWLADRSDLYGPIIAAIHSAFTEHDARKATAEKN